VTLKLVARWADACNIGGEPEAMRHKFAVLRQHCDALGRDYDSITRSTNLAILPLRPGENGERMTQSLRSSLGMTYEAFREVYFVGTTAQVVERVQSRVDAGANYVIFYLPLVAYDPDLLDLLASEVIPHIK